MIKQMMNANSRPMLAPCALTASIRDWPIQHRDQSLRDDRSRRKAAGMMPQATLSQHELVAAAGRCRAVARRSRLAPLHRPDIDLRCQRAVDGTLVGDLKQAASLLGVERPAQRNGPFDAVEHAFFGLAVCAIGGVNSGMAEFDRHPLERQGLALSVEPNRHRRAGSEPRKEEIVGTWTAVETADLDRLVGEEA